MKNMICYIISYIIEAIVLYHYTTSLFQSKNRTLHKCITLFFLYGTSFFISIIEIPAINFLLYYVTTFIFIYTQHNIKWFIATFHAITLTAFMAIGELIVFGAIEYSGSSYYSEDKYFYHLVLITVFGKLIFIIFTLILLHFKKTKNPNFVQQDKSALMLLSIPLSSVLILCTFISFDSNSSMHSYTNQLIVASSIFLIFSNLIIFGANEYTQKKNYDYTEIKLLLQKELDSAEYYQMLLDQNQNQKILIHDIKRHLQSIEILNENNDKEQIFEYIHQLLKSPALNETTKKCDNKLLNIILLRYERKCEESNISFHCDIRKNTTNFIYDTDLTSLFCNLLDNAYEAAERIPDSFIDILVSNRETLPVTTICVINSCRNNPFSPDGKMLISSKKDKANHGFGIKSINNIVKKYSGNIQMYYSSDNQTFHTVITIKNIRDRL